MNRVFLILFLVIITGWSTAQGQSLAEYYTKLNENTGIIVTHLYQNPDTSILVYEKTQLDILCNCIYEEGSIHCLMDLNDDEDDITLNFTLFLNDTARRIDFLWKIMSLNNYFPIFHSVLYYMPTELVVQSVQNYDKVQPGDIFTLKEVYYAPEFSLSSKCRSDITGYKQSDPPKYDLYIDKIKVNETVTDRHNIRNLMLDPFNEYIDCTSDKNDIFYYPKLEKLLVPIDQTGIDSCRIGLINKLKASNPQAVIHLSFQLVDSVGRAVGEITTEAFKSLQKIKVPLYIHFEPLYSYELDSVLAFIPQGKIEGLRLIFPDRPASKAVDLGQFQSIQHLENLEEIYFVGKTKNLPPGIEKLRSLKLLSGAFESIPYNLGHIRSLEALQLKCNYMDSFNSFDNQLTNLRLLQLDYLNDIKEIPSSFRKCEYLQVLKLTFWDSLSNLVPFYDLPIEYLILGTETRRSWDFTINEIPQMEELKLVSSGSGNYFDSNRPPFTYIKKLYVGRLYQKRYMSSLNLSIIDVLNSQDKLILLDSPEDLQIDGVNDSLNELIKVDWQRPLYEIKR